MNFYVSPAWCFAFLEALLKFSLKSTIIVHVKKNTWRFNVPLFSGHVVCFGMELEWKSQRPNVKVRHLFCRMQHVRMKITLKNVLDVSLAVDRCVWNWLSLLVRNNMIFFFQVCIWGSISHLKRKTHLLNPNWHHWHSAAVMHTNTQWRAHKKVKGKGS